CILFMSLPSRCRAQNRHLLLPTTPQSHSRESQGQRDLRRASRHLFGSGEMNHERWAAQDWRRAKELLQRGYSINAVSTLMGRPPKQVSEKLRWENTSVEKREARRLRINARRHATGEYKSTPRPDGPSTGPRADPGLFEERDRRLAAPKTLSGWLLGDPPVGFSALDRKRQGIVEARWIDKRTAQLQRKPTLAGVEG